jgi:hypothetical protein
MPRILKKTAVTIPYFFSNDKILQQCLLINDVVKHHRIVRDHMHSLLADSPHHTGLTYFCPRWLPHLSIFPRPIPNKQLLPLLSRTNLRQTQYHSSCIN